MNERIQELALQANIQLDNLPDDTFIPLENFAELIVRECLEIVDEEGCGEGGSVRAYSKIKEHFGVE